MSTRVLAAYNENKRTRKELSRMCKRFIKKLIGISALCFGIGILAAFLLPGVIIAFLEAGIILLAGLMLAK